MQRLAVQQLGKAFVARMQGSPLLVRWPWVASVKARLF